MSKLTELTIAEAREGLREKSFSSRELTQAHVDAVEAANDALNAFVLATPDHALAQAKAPMHAAKKERRAARRVAARHQGSVLHRGHSHHCLLAHS